jgi:hypothetical protein
MRLRPSDLESRASAKWCEVRKGSLRCNRNDLVQIWSRQLLEPLSYLSSPNLHHPKIKLTSEDPSAGRHSSLLWPYSSQLEVLDRGRNGRSAGYWRVCDEDRRRSHFVSLILT